MPISEKILAHEKFGRVQIIRSRRTRRISISARPFHPLKVTLPIYESFGRAERFLEEKEKWIHKTLEKIRKLEEQYTIFKENTPFRTRDHELRIKRTEEDKPRVSLTEEKILVRIPETSDIQSPEIQDMIRWGILAAWRKEAKEYLPMRLKELSGKHQLPYNRVIIKNNKSRWGSCSPKNNINLNLHLMRLPDPLIDYILLHELVHTIHNNHGQRFWKKMESICPNARSFDKELRGYRIEIY